MKRNLKEAMINRRSYYALKNESPISDQEIENIIKGAVKYVPSAFNSQSTRVVLLLNDQNKKLWDITFNTLKAILPNDEAISKTKSKIENCFASGYGTVLFYEDQNVVNKLQEQFPTYKENFPLWSAHTSGMHQWVIWTMLEDQGFGASLQHYNPLIDQQVAHEWNIPASWKLIAQMPFGLPNEAPGEKEFQPLEERIFIFK